MDTATMGEKLSETSTQRHIAKATKQQARFLKGPVPLDWLQTAACLPGKTLAAALALWYLAGLKRQQHDLALTTTVVERFGVDRKARHRALAALEDIKLVSVVRRKGVSPRVTILGVRAAACENAQPGRHLCG